MYGGHASIDVRVVDLRDKVFVGFLAKVILYDPNVSKVVHILVFHRPERHGPCSHSESLLVLLLVTDEDDKGQDRLVPLHQLNHEIHAQVYPFDNQRLMPLFCVLYQMAQVVQHHLTLSLVAPDDSLSVREIQRRR